MSRVATDRNEAERFALVSTATQVEAYCRQVRNGDAAGAAARSALAHAHAFCEAQERLLGENTARQSTPLNHVVSRFCGEHTQQSLHPRERHGRRARRRARRRALSVRSSSIIQIPVQRRRSRASMTASPSWTRTAARYHLIAVLRIRRPQSCHIPWYRTRLALGRGANAASFAKKSNASNTTLVVPSRYGALSS